MLAGRARFWNKKAFPCRFAFKRGDPVPRFHYETRAFSKVVSNTDLTDNDLGRRHEALTLQFFFTKCFCPFSRKISQNRQSSFYVKINIPLIYHKSQYLRSTNVVKYYFISLISFLSCWAMPNPCAELSILSGINYVVKVCAFDLITMPVLVQRIIIWLR